MPIFCEIVSQDRQVFAGEVDMVVAPGADGVMGILPHHSPLFSTLKVGELKVRRGADEEIFAVSGGLIEVRPDRIIILADAAERADEIDVARAEEARRKAETQLAAAPAQHTEAYLAALAALRRSSLRLNVASRRTQKK
jgi:F-type H+-transporting ATPase subunit epsilon